MPRRSISRKKHTEVELFPFLSILACTIGTLILLIIVLTTQALNKQEVVIVAKENENGLNASKNPRYIECRETGVVLYPSEQFVTRKELEKPNSPLKKLIAEVQQNRDREYLIITLRPNAIDVFEMVRNIIEQENADKEKDERIDIGYEPIDAGWTLKTETETETETKATVENEQ